MKHVWVRDEDGKIKTWDRDSYPYCFYRECRECGDWVCDGGCDGDIDSENCPAREALILFDIDELGQGYLYQ